MALKRGTESTNQALSKSTMRGTAILITVSLTFVILTGPASIYLPVVKDNSDLIVHALLHVPKTLNHDLNSVMYCVVGSKFRRELIELICCGKKFSGRRRGSVTETGSTDFQQC